jgi:2-polyprenyl-6-methoxyphenol hydroxylase-like FAD-dependent oxidoreductase
MTVIHTVDALRSSYAAVVVGARCAGAATAMLLARWCRRLVVEQAARGSDTLSTLAMMRRACCKLSRWGLLDDSRGGTPRIETTTFHYGTDAVEIRNKPRDGVDAYARLAAPCSIRCWRTRPPPAGADVAYRVRLRELVRDDRGRVTGVVVEGGGVAREIAATIVIGADGVHSTVASRVGVEPYRVGQHKGGVIYTRAGGLPNTGYHWHYAPGMSVGVIPTNGETLVFAATTSEAQPYREMASALPIPVGFKNGTGGSVRTAIHAVQTASRPTCFVGTASCDRRGARWALRR